MFVHAWFGIEKLYVIQLYVNVLKLTGSSYVLHPSRVQAVFFGTSTMNSLPSHHDVRVSIEAVQYIVIGGHC